MTSVEEEFKERYIKTITTWILFHRMVHELCGLANGTNYFDAEAVLVKMDMPSTLNVVKNLYETDKAGLDKLYNQGVKEIEQLKKLVNQQG